MRLNQNHYDSAVQLHPLLYSAPDAKTQKKLKIIPTTLTNESTLTTYVSLVISNSYIKLFFKKNLEKLSPPVM